MLVMSQTQKQLVSEKAEVLTKIMDNMRFSSMENCSLTFDFFSLSLCWTNSSKFVMPVAIVSSQVLGLMSSCTQTCSYCCVLVGMGIYFYKVDTMSY